MALTARWHTDLAELSREAWNALAEPLATPFLEWEWLRHLELSGCVGADTGWMPCHLCVWRGNSLAAAAPLYLKAHSWGEYVFDQEWARAAFGLGIGYYPKLVGTAPFTPVTGYRFLVAPDEDPAAMTALMLREIHRFCERAGISGCHFLHIDSTWAETMADLGLGKWLHHGLVWENRDYCGFDDYLASFRHRQRKNIKRERRKVAESGLRFRLFPPGEVEPAHMRHMFSFYAATCYKYWGGSQYLNPTMFAELARHFGHRLLLVGAHAADAPEDFLAMSMFVHKDDWLYGRYWGCREEFEFLHFEACYYQPIDWAIATGVRYFDAGSGGSRQKTRRGFPARRKFSLHHFYHPTLRRLWDLNIDRINRLEGQVIDEINGCSAGTGTTGS